MTQYGLLGEQAAFRRTCLSLFRREYFLNTNLVNQMLTTQVCQMRPFLVVCKMCANTVWPKN